MAVAIGCSLLASAVPATASNVFNEQTAWFTNIEILVTRGSPCVTVPVLSNTILFTCNMKLTFQYFCNKKIKLIYFYTT